MKYTVTLWGSDSDRVEPARIQETTRRLAVIDFSSDISEERMIEVLESLKNDQHPGIPHHEVVCTTKCFSDPRGQILGIIHCTCGYEASSWEDLSGHALTCEKRL